MNQRIGVIGAGYVGLTTAACLAHLGHEVVCADIDEARVDSLNRGIIPILEDRLPELVGQGLESGNLAFVVGAPAAVGDAELVFLCVPTPHGEDGRADLSFVETVCREIAPHLKPGSIVINKSTMPVGSVRRVQRFLSSTGAGLHEVEVVANPEFLAEGHAVRDFLSPSRIVLGCDSPAAAVRVAGLYENLQAPVLVTSPESAEMTKYASNAYLATRVSFVNSIANLCDEVGADVKDVVLGMGHDPRIGPAFLQPGPGYGGSCFPKDVSALLGVARDAGYDFDLLASAQRVNEHQRDRIVTKITGALGGDLAAARIAVWGLAFKAGTDDVRDSPALDIAQRLIARGANVVAHDPAAAPRAAEACPGLTIAGDPYEACTGAQILAVLTEWDEYRWLNFGRVHELLAAPVIVDARNLLDPAAMRRHGFSYQGVGRS